MSALIGSTGFVGGHLQKNFEFTHAYNRTNISEIQGLETDLLICAGLPAEKWKANMDPETDWWNMANLAQKLSSVSADKAILISTIDVYQPPLNVTESDKPNYIGESAYGRNRAWFETYFVSQFSDTLIIRLPGLFAGDLRKNFIYDLIHNRSDQLSSVNQESKFQFYNVEEIWDLINKCNNDKITLLNVATEPISAQEIAGVFNVNLSSSKDKIEYRMKSKHFKSFDGKNGYIQSKEYILDGISRLRNLS